MSDGTNQNLNSGLFWAFMERIGSQGVSLVVSIILARLIIPSEYGIISAVQIFTTIATVFVTGGISSALIQKKDADELDYSSMFWYNTVFSLFVYLIVYLTSPFLVRILNASYDYGLLTKVLRISGIGFVFASFNSFYRTILVRELKFKKTFFVTLLGTLTSAAIGIFMAYKGFGVWALVAQTIVSYAANSVFLVLFTRWIPKFRFSWNRLKPMLGYGYKLMTSSLLTTVYMEANSMVVGNRFSSETLAFYNKGASFPKLIVANIISAINTVLFPVMTKIKTREENVSFIKKFNKTSSFIIAPMMFGFAAVAPAFIEVLLGPQWLPCVPFLQLACVDYALQPIGISNLQYWKASGRATLYLVADIIKKVFAFALIILTVCLNKGALFLAIMQIVSTVFGIFINLIPQKKYLNYSVFSQIKDVLLQYLLSAVMFAAVYFLGQIPWSNVIVKLVVQIVFGAAIYIGTAKLVKMPELDDVMGMIGKRLKKGGAKVEK